MDAKFGLVNIKLGRDGESGFEPSAIANTSKLNISMGPEGINATCFLGINFISSIDFSQISLLNPTNILFEMQGN